MFLGIAAFVEANKLAVALVLFLATYVLLLAFPRRRAHIAVTSAVIFILLGILPWQKVMSTIDWNVLLMIAGTMGTVALFIESQMPAKLADLIILKVPNVKWTVIALSLFAGIISAFVDNVATVLMVAPVALTISKRLSISPIPSIVAISIASNLQGAATLVGDTTSILLGGHANMNFADFFFYRGKIGMFWVTQAGAIAATLVLLWAFRKYKQKVAITEITKVKDYFPSFLLLGTVVLLILASFVTIPVDVLNNLKNGIICMTLLAIGLIRKFIITKDKTVFVNGLKEIDFFTLSLLAGLFLVIGGISEAGVIKEISNIFVKLSNNNLFILYTLIVWASVFLSAFIDNIPYIATMLPVAQGIGELMAIDPTILYFGLLVGATLGGNLTPIGASANIAGLGILRKEGFETKTGTFMKISVPYTLSAVLTGYILVWLIWS
ncbi:MAG: SLC13 family permease [Eubacteriales bacterium]|nr:SLC13 family permease [Eubacteriales bacterium]